MADENGRRWEVVRFIVPIAITLVLTGVPGIYFYGQQNQKLETLDRDFITYRAENNAELKATQLQVAANTSDVSVLKNDIQNIKENGEKTYTMLSALVDRLRD